jgi:phosphatidylglycerophosphate synthase
MRHGVLVWIAHALTLSRIPIAAVFWLTYGDPRVSLALVALAALTDAADGAVARRALRRGATASTLGEWLDPFADKVFVVTVLGAIQTYDPAPWWIVGLIVARELALLPLVAIYRVVVRERGEHAFRAGAIGKAATIAELAAVCALIAYRPAALPLAIAAAVLGVTAVVGYVATRRGTTLEHA